MLIVTLQIDAPAGSAQGIKEALAYYCEIYGDTKVLSIDEKLPQQLGFEGFSPKPPPQQRRKRN